MKSSFTLNAAWVGGGGRGCEAKFGGLLFHVSNFCHTEPYHLFLCVIRLRSLFVTSFYIILWFSWAVVFAHTPLVTSLTQLWLLNTTVLRKGHLCHYHIFTDSTSALPHTFIACVCALSGKDDEGVQFSCSIVSDSSWPHGLQHTRSPCPSPTPGVYSNSCPLGRWYHPAISSSVVPFSSPLQPFPA